MTGARPSRHPVVVAVLGVVALVALVGLGACSTTATTSGGPGSTPRTTPITPTKPVTGSITVSAAASLTEPFTKIGDAFEAANPGSHVSFNFDSSATLAKQIQNGAPADVFASADEPTMKKLTDAQLTSAAPQVFARNHLTIVVKPGNPKKVTSLADLATVGVVSLCGSDVPCGKYADQILKQGGVTIPDDKVTRGQNVKATLSAVADGDADAAIVYVTDATAVGAKVQVVELPDTVDVTANYPIAPLAASTNPDAATAFIAFVQSPAGQDILRAAGFLPPP